VSTLVRSSRRCESDPHHFRRRRPLDVLSAGWTTDSDARGSVLPVSEETRKKGPSRSRALPLGNRTAESKHWGEKRGGNVASSRVPSRSSKGEEEENIVEERSKKVFLRAAEARAVLFLFCLGGKRSCPGAREERRRHERASNPERDREGGTRDTSGWSAGENRREPVVACLPRPEPQKPLAKRKGKRRHAGLSRFDGRRRAVQKETSREKTPSTDTRRRGTTPAPKANGSNPSSSLPVRAGRPSDGTQGWVRSSQ